jgi:hypothetical protein
MPDLHFGVLSAEAQRYAVSPLLAFKIRVYNASKEPIHSVALSCQVRIEPARRPYRTEEKPLLADLFGEPARWGQTLRSFLWTHTHTLIHSFTDTIEIDLPVPCTFDFNVAVTKYFHALSEGEVPLSLLFSGTIFYTGVTGNLQVAQVPWSKEASFFLPVRVWQDMMDHYYPNCAWLCLHRDTFEQLLRYKTGRGLPTWEQTLEQLLSRSEEGPPS